MAEPISIQQLKDASEDAISLAEFINEPEDVMIPRRLASDIHSLQYYLEYMKAFSQRSYETYDEMVANVSNLSENSSVFVTNDLDTSKNGIYTYNGVGFVKGDYQPENLAKEFVEYKLGGLQVFDGKVRAQDVEAMDGNNLESIFAKVSHSVSDVETLRNTVGKSHGQLVFTANYYADRSGGGALYKWVGGTLDNGFTHINGWELILPPKVDIRTAGVIMYSPEEIQQATSLGELNQTTLVRAVVKDLSLLGGGIFKIPEGTLIASFHAQPYVTIEGTLDAEGNRKTFIRGWTKVTGHENNLFIVAQPYFTIKDLDIDGSFEGGVGQCMSVRVHADNFTMINCKSHGSRYDGISLNGSYALIHDCYFVNNGRNQITVGKGHDIVFSKCLVEEQKSFYGQALYMVDIEPNGPDGIWYNITFKDCEFNRKEEHADSPFLINQAEENDTRNVNLLIDGCEFKGYTSIGPRLQPLRGLYIRNCTFHDARPFGQGTGAAAYVTQGVIENCNFLHNETSLFSGGVYFTEGVIWRFNYFAADTDYRVVMDNGSIKYRNIFEYPERAIPEARWDKFSLVGDNYDSSIASGSTVKRVQRLIAGNFTLPKGYRGVVTIRNMVDSRPLADNTYWGSNGRTAWVDIYFDYSTDTPKITLDDRFNNSSDIRVDVTTDYQDTGVSNQISMNRVTADNGPYIFEIKLIGYKAQNGVQEFIDSYQQVALNGGQLSNALNPTVSSNPPKAPVKNLVYFDNNTQQPLVWSGTEWMSLLTGKTPVTPLRTTGSTAQRPSEGVPVGYQFFDTTLGYPVYYKSEGIWVDSTGATK